MNLIDTHCHLDLEKHFPQFDIELGITKQAGVTGIILPGVTKAGWGRIMDLTSHNKSVWAAPGLHPLYLDHHRPHHLEELEELINGKGSKGHGAPVAIGEIGLDYYVKSVNRNAQQQLFEKQLEIAARAHLPVLLHVRKAHDQVLATLRRKNFCHGGIVHAFNGSLQQAQHFIKLGFGIGIGGTISYARATKIRAVASQLPREALVLETDAPDIPLAERRDQPNHPQYLPEVLHALAKLRGEPQDLTAQYTRNNTKRILGLII